MIWFLVGFDVVIFSFYCMLIFVVLVFEYVVLENLEKN